MATHVKIWFDREGDFIEVLFSDKPVSAELPQRPSLSQTHQAPYT